MGNNVRAAAPSDNIFLDGLRKSLGHLIPGSSARILYKQQLKAHATPQFTYTLGGATAGVTIGSHHCILTITVPSKEVSGIELSRPLVALSRVERRVLGRLPEAVVGLTSNNDNRGHELSQKIATAFVHDHILVAKMLRGDSRSSFYTAAMVLRLLQDLAFLSYESTPATSGILFAKSAAPYLNALDPEIYRFDEFSQSQPLNSEFFREPASYRYVDGKNCFYLIDRRRIVLGTISIRKAAKYTLLQRSINEHVAPLISTMPGRPWLILATNNGDLQVIARKRISFQWSRNHWQLRDLSIPRQILASHLSEDAPVDVLLSCLLTLSTQRTGTVILIPTDEATTPTHIGGIDTSPLADQLRDSFIAQNLNDLVQANRILGVLASDGLTTLSKTARILGCGQILDLRTSQGGAPSGGGRTQAAVAASHFGLSVKVSEDGPITFYKRASVLFAF